MNTIKCPKFTEMEGLPRYTHYQSGGVSSEVYLGMPAKFYKAIDTSKYKHKMNEQKSMADNVIT